MLRQLQEVGEFVRRLGCEVKFGELSRAQLRLLRVELSGEKAECDWMARPRDAWDNGLPARVGARNASTQAIKDAIKVRELLFRVFPDLREARVRVYRESLDSALELIIEGTVRRDELAPTSVRSLAMKAKLIGLRFWLEDGILENLEPVMLSMTS
jgi:hypothetical protein